MSVQVRPPQQKIGPKRKGTKMGMASQRSILFLQIVGWHCYISGVVLKDVNAGVAQLVERCLAKAEVFASSRLVTRSRMSVH